MAPVLKIRSNFLKGTVSVISSDPPCKDGNANYLIDNLKDIAIF